MVVSIMANYLSQQVNRGYWGRIQMICNVCFFIDDVGCIK